MTKKPPRNPSIEVTGELRGHLERLSEQAQNGELTAHRRRTLQVEVQSVMGELSKLLQAIDPISQPVAVFDPSNPKVVGRFVSLALVAQERQQLADVMPAYGAGVYAIYYVGPFEPYAPISGTETPIYVGQASPQMPNARTPMEQGVKLTGRLTEHRKNVAKATSTLSLDDFQYRALVVQSGWETAAEDYLIHLFRPIWNKEVKILFGFGKHGDASETRANKKSPWDTLHEARKWATTENAKSPEKIIAELVEHFDRHPPFTDIQRLLDSFLEELRQV